MDEDLLERLADDVTSRRAPARGAAARIPAERAAEGQDGVAGPVNEVERIEHVWENHPQRRARAFLLRVAALVIGDAEVVRGTRRVARGDARPALGQRPAAGEVLV